MVPFTRPRLKLIRSTCFASMAALIFLRKLLNHLNSRLLSIQNILKPEKRRFIFPAFFHFCRNGCDLIELIKLQLKSPQAEQVVTFFIYLKCHDFFAESKLPNAKIFRAQKLLPYLCLVGNSDPSENRTQDFSFSF